MEYMYAAMLLHSAGKEISEDAITNTLTAAGISADSSRVKALVAALADVNIEEDQISIFLLLFDKITELCLNAEQGLWQALARGHTVHSQVNGGYTCSTQLVYEGLVHEISISGHIHEEPVSHTVSDDF